MKYLNLQETDATLTAIVDEISATQSEVVITRNGLPVARIVPCSSSNLATKYYPLRGLLITIVPDFDEPMSELWDALAK
jgi:prevent-host-death family protein